MNEIDQIFHKRNDWNKQIPMTDRMTQEYERWFRDHGQFLPPCDAINDPEKLEPFKAWGFLAWSEAQDMIDEAQTELTQTKEDLDDAKARLEEIKIKAA